MFGHNYSEAAPWYGNGKPIGSRSVQQPQVGVHGAEGPRSDRSYRSYAATEAKRSSGTTPAVGVER
jgi:hypothetical protein